MRKIILILSIFNGMVSFSQEKTNYFYINTEEGEIHLTPSEIEIYLKNKVIFYENNGFPFTEVKLENIKDNKDQKILYFKKVVKISKEEKENHSKFLKTFLKKNFFN